MKLVNPLSNKHRRLPNYNPEMPPGTLEPVPDSLPPKFHVIAYGPDRFVEDELASPDDIDAYLGQWPVVWLNIDGLGDTGVIERLGKRFNLHRLALEDVLHVYQRPKIDPYDEHLFVVLRMLSMSGKLHSEQLSLFMGKGWVLTFQERPGDPLDPVRRRIRQGQGRIRSTGADYLAYSLIDAVIDGSYPVLEAYDDRLETLEQQVTLNPSRQTIASIYQVKRDLLHLRRAIWPEREVLSTLFREETPLIDQGTRPYLRDTYDHVTQIIDISETFRELASGLMDAYLSSISNRMNEVMKVLTIIATIFIPLSFVAGVYGMNFDPEVSPWNMPELGWRWGYFGALGVMALMAGGMLAFFIRKGWIGGKSDSLPKDE